jgi:hypothetical protein
MALQKVRATQGSACCLQVRFVSAAESARCQLEVPDAPALLHNQEIYIHVSDAARKPQASNALALKRVALALGAAVRHRLVG